MPYSLPSPLGGHSLLVFLAEVVLLLLVALALGRLATRFGLPAVSGELCAGVLVGPTVLGHLVPSFHRWLLPPQAAQIHLLDAAGQIGVIMLVGITGADIDFEIVRRRGATAVRVAIAGLVLPLALGLAAGLLAPRQLLPTGTDRTLFALFVGVAMSVSALPVIAKTLGDMGLLHRDFGQLTIAAGVVDDVIGWLLLAVVSAAGIAGLHWHAIYRPLIWLAVFVTLALTAGRLVTRAALAAAGRNPEPGPIVGVGMLVILGCAVATQSMGLEASFGAFVGGLMLATAKAQDLRRLEPLRTAANAVFAPLFFATAGLRLDLTLTILVLVAIVTSLMAPPILRLAESRISYSVQEEERRLRLAALR